MALLLLRHALSISDNEGDDDASTMFSVSRVVFFVSVFLLILATQLVLSVGLNHSISQ
jgi:hypothetical protein